MKAGLEDTGRGWILSCEQHRDTEDFRHGGDMSRFAFWKEYS